MIFYARQLCFYELGTEIRGFRKKAENMIPEELMFKKKQIFSKSLLFIPLIILDIVVGYLLADTYRHFFKNWQKLIFEKLKLDHFCPKSTWRRNWAKKFTKGVFVSLAHGGHMQKFGKSVR